MKSVILGVILMVAISAIAGVILSTQEQSSTGAYISSNGSVRLSE